MTRKGAPRPKHATEGSGKPSRGRARRGPKPGAMTASDQALARALFGPGRQPRQDEKS